MTNQQCAICLEDIASHACQLPCNHTFHSTCALKALSNKMECPLCRAEPISRPPPSDGISFQIEFPIQEIRARFLQARVDRRRYMARRARMIRNSPRLKVLQNKIACTKREVRAAKVSYEISEGQARMEVEKMLVGPRKEFVKVKRRLCRYERLMQQSLHERLGSEEPQPISSRSSARSALVSMLNAMSSVTADSDEEH